MISTTTRFAGYTLFVALTAWGCADQPTAVTCAPTQLRGGCATALADRSENSAADLSALATTTWNKRATDLLFLRPPGNAQAAVSRMLTYLSIAQYRAILAAKDGKVKSLHPSTSAAIGGASAAVLRSFFPLDVASIEAQLSADLAAVQGNHNEDEDVAAGEAIGRSVAADVLAQAATDNYFVANPGAPPVGAGYWVSAAGVAPVRGMYGARPFFMKTTDQLRPPPPPAFGSPDFLAGLAEIRTISDTRTADQILIAQTYAWGTAPFTVGQLNLIVDQLIVDHHRSEREAARILAYANAATFDAGIACYDAKFAYWFIRPSQADPLITMPIALPNHPSYPSGHSCLTSALMTVAIDAFPSEREQLESLITTTGLSRMYGGLHYRFDVEAGQVIGRAAAALALAGSIE